MSKNHDSGVSASFIDLLCCALGGVILLVVLFSVKLKPGNAVESSTFVIVEFTLTLPLDAKLETLSEAVEAARRCGPAVSLVGTSTPDITYLPIPVIGSNDVCSYRWLTNRDKDENHRPVVRAHLVLVDPVRDLRLRANVSPSVNDEERKRIRVSFFTNRKKPLGPVDVDECPEYEVERVNS